VPSTIVEQPLFEEAAANWENERESIRIYADNDVYALLADVENEMSKMSAPVAAAPVSLSDTERKQLHRARSHELLNSMSKNLNSPMPPSPQAPSPPMKNSPTTEPEAIFLTNAVFRPSPPERSYTAS
jgi:hypothetical protein